MDPTVETVLKPPLLFLHGQAFTSAVWARTYSLQLAAQRGHRAVAIDLPGFGRSVAGSERIDPFVFLATAIHELHLGRPVLVAPRHEPMALSVSAFLPLAPLTHSHVKRDQRPSIVRVSCHNLITCTVSFYYMYICTQPLRQVRAAVSAARAAARRATPARVRRDRACEYRKLRPRCIPRRAPRLCSTHLSLT